MARFRKRKTFNLQKPTVRLGCIRWGWMFLQKKVVLHMYFQGTEICKAYSKVKGTRELDLMQAISYAAHMMYKFAEQKELDKEI